MRDSSLFIRQRGAVLVVGMIMLGMITMMVLSAATMSTGNLQVVANMQFRDEAIAAGNYAIEEVISTDFTTLPTTNNVDVDINGNGAIDYRVVVQPPVCLRWRIIPTSELDATNPAELQCFLGSGGGGSALGGVGGTNSFCADTQWELTASVTSDTGASAVIRQGLTKRMTVIIAGNSCD